MHYARCLNLSLSLSQIPDTSIPSPFSPPALATLATAAADVEPALARALGDGELREGLGIRGVDAHEAVEVALLGSQAQAQSKALRHLAGVGAHIVQAHDLVLLQQQPRHTPKHGQSRTRHAADPGGAS